ncbi:MAG: hypothetical protein HQL82_17085 [Magnetococcales bacterium]|nr:hypothetical protein [Magnetococcales bacterium]
MPSSQSQGNTLFQTFGHLVIEIFSRDNWGRTLPTLVPRLEDPVARGGEGVEPELASFFDPVDLKQAGDSIEYLRHVLLRERERGKRAPGSPTGPGGPVDAQFESFARAVEQGDEAQVRGNLFHDLAKLIFRLNLSGLEGVFRHQAAPLLRDPPRPVPAGRSWSELRRPASGEGWGAWAARLAGRLALDIKAPLEAVLFLISALTSAWWFNATLQTPNWAALFPGMFTGPAGEGARYGTALLLGLSLTALVLELKRRLLEGIAERGQVWRGLVETVLRYPRWMAVALPLTVLSMVANYDALMLLANRQADATLWLTRVERAVNETLGRVGSEAGESSLQTLATGLDATVAEILARFHGAVNAELAATTPGGPFQKGPEYWGKHFLVHGGYRPGLNDVAQVLGPAVQAAQIDRLLVSSGLDLTLPLTDRITALAAAQNRHLAQTRQRVRERMRHLREALERSSSSGLSPLFPPEAYRVSGAVQRIATDLEHTLHRYRQIVEQVTDLTGRHAGLLIRLGGRPEATPARESLVGRFPNPRLPGLAALHRTPRVLTDTLAPGTWYTQLRASDGRLTATVWLLGVLLAAIALDLGALLLHARWTARRGRLDRAALAARQDHLVQWENRFITLCRRFFHHPEVREIFRHLGIPPEEPVRDALHRLVESIDPASQDPLDRPWPRRLARRLPDLLTPVRNPAITGFNARARALSRLADRWPVHFPRLMDLLFPGLNPARGLGNGGFQDLAERIAQGRQRNRELFFRDMLRARRSQLRRARLDPRDSWTEQKLLMDSLLEIEQRIYLHQVADSAGPGGIGGFRRPAGNGRNGSGEGGYGDRTPLPWEEGDALFGDEKGLAEPSRLGRLWRLVLQRGLHPEPAPYPHTRRDWLVHVSPTLDRTSRTLASLEHELPRLRQLLESTLPFIESHHLRPALVIRGRFGETWRLEKLPDLDPMQQQFQEVRQRVREICAAAEQMEEQAGMVSEARMNEFQELVSRIQAQDEQGATFLDRVDALMTRIQDVAGLAAAMEKRIERERQVLLANLQERIGEFRHTLLRKKMALWKTQALPGSGREAASPQRVSPQNHLEQADRRTNAIVSEIEGLSRTGLPGDEQELDRLRALEREARDILQRLGGLTPETLP